MQQATTASQGLTASRRNSQKRIVGKRRRGYTAYYPVPLAVVIVGVGMTVP